MGDIRDLLYIWRNFISGSANEYINIPNRAAQESFMMYNCIMNSLTNSAKRQVRLRGKSFPFVIGGVGIGPMLLKVVIMVSHVDTRVTISAVRTKLSSLDGAMRDFNSDTEKFNEHVVELLEKLSARGEETQDLLVNLFKGYKQDLEFVDYIKKKEDFYEEGRDVTFQQLMDWTLNKFKARKENGTWCQRSSEEETIIALQAQINQFLKKGKAGSEKSGVNRSQKKDQASKDKVKWFKVAPKSGEPISKEVNGKVWHWCPNHKSWTRHTASECKGINYKPKKEANSNGNVSEATTNPQLRKCLGTIR
jgi:hypothetical protein